MTRPRGSKNKPKVIIPTPVVVAVKEDKPSPVVKARAKKVVAPSTAQYAVIEVPGLKTTADKLIDGMIAYVIRCSFEMTQRELDRYVRINGGSKEQAAARYIIGLLDIDDDAVREKWGMHKRH